MKPRDACWLAVGALVYPLGIILGHLLHHRSIIYPH